MQRIIHLFNYFYIVLILLWEPLHYTIITFDNKGRIVVFLSIFVFLLNLISSTKFKRLAFSKPIIFWGGWIIYSSINLIVIGYYGYLPFLFHVFLRLFTPFIVMLIVSLEWQYAPKKVLYLLLVTFTIYGAFTLLLINSSSEFVGEQNVGALGNMGPLNTMFIIFYSGLLFAHKWLKQRNLFFYIIFAFFVIFLIATRKAFGAGLIMLAFIFLSQFNLSSKKIAQVVVLSLLTFWGVNFGLNNII